MSYLIILILDRQDNVILYNQEPSQSLKFLSVIPLLTC